MTEQSPQTPPESFPPLFSSPLRRVVVMGSLNMDLVTRTARHPQIGETLSGDQFTLTPGGKGANQAVACARLGLDTTMIGCVGDDVFAESLLESLRSSGVQTEHVLTRPGVSSGIAAITVDERGQNTIIVVPGANAEVGVEALERLDSLLGPDVLLLMQLEIPLETVTKAADMARRKGAVVVLDPAPARDLPVDLYPLIDIITPNQTEAALLVGTPVETVIDARQAARSLSDRGVTYSIVKLGEMGVIFKGAVNNVRHISIRQPSFAVEVVDTVAAGDAFNGGLAAGLCAGLPVDDVLKWASAAGALCVTRRGAQAAMPTRDELMTFLASRDISV